MMNIKDMSKEERARLLAELQNEEKQSRIERRETYEGLRAEMMHDVWQRLTRWKSHTNLTHPGKYFRPSKVKIMRPTSPK